MDTAPPTLRALSLWRPWPWLILHAGKDVENRPWATGYRGPLILHAAKTLAQPILDQLLAGLPASTPRGGDPAALGYVGVADLVEVHHARHCQHPNGRPGCSPWAEPDAWHWRLTNPRALPNPIPGPGRQRLFSPPPAVTAAVTRLTDRRREGARQ